MLQNEDKYFDNRLRRLIILIYFHDHEYLKNIISKIITGISNNTIQIDKLSIHNMEISTPDNVILKNIFANQELCLIHDVRSNIKSSWMVLHARMIHKDGIQQLFSFASLQQHQDNRYCWTVTLKGSVAGNCSGNALGAAGSNNYTLSKDNSFCPNTNLDFQSFLFLNKVFNNHIHLSN